MTAIWPGSRIPYIDTDGPMVGAQLYFYNVGTTTPQQVYADGSLSTTLDQPIKANARGMFPAVYLNPTPGNYRVKMLDADNALIFDDDDISVPQDADYVPPDTGDTSETLLFRTGDLKFRYDTGAHSGWVRAAGRTIGSASSGASERANSDTEDLFLHLWSADSTLSVSGGRGGSAAGDWAANKTITLPDMRDRVPIGLGDMGNSDANLIADTLVDASESNTTLGATAGASTVALTTPQLPAHTHTGSGTTGGQSNSHSHIYPVYSGDAAGNGASDGSGSTSGTFTTNANTEDHTHNFTFTSNSTGSGEGHPNIQPGLFATWYLKL